MRRRADLCYSPSPIPPLSESMASLSRYATSLFDSVPPRIRGVILMMTAAFAAVSMNVTIRQISDEIHVFEISFFRSVFSVLLFMPLLWSAGPSLLRTNRIGLLALRSVLHTAAMLSFVVGLTLVPLAQVTALTFTSPLFATLLAVVFLREHMSIRRWAGLLVGLAGALVILRPGFVSVGTGPLLIILSSAIWGCTLICIKLLSRTESTVTIAVYAALLQVPMAFIAALFVWQWPTTEQLLFMALVGAFAAISQLCLAQAFRDADATLVLPADFSKLVWASIAGFLFFGEIPEIWSWVGAAIVFGAIIYMAYQECEKPGASRPE